MQCRTLDEQLERIKMDAESRLNEIRAEIEAKVWKIFFGFFKNDFQKLGKAFHRRNGGTREKFGRIDGQNWQNGSRERAFDGGTEEDEHTLPPGERGAHILLPGIGGMREE